MSAERPLSYYLLGFLAARHYAPASKRQRRYILGHFCDLTGDPTPSELSPDDLLNWWAIVTEGTKPTTAKAYYGAVKMFLKHLRDIEVLEGDPLRAIRPPREPRSSPKILTEAEVARLFAECEGNTRLTAIIAVMLGCGLRCVDTAQLMVDDLNLDEGLVVIHGKGGHKDLLPVPSAVADALRAYLAERPARPGSAVFRHLHSEDPLAVEAIRYMVLRLMHNAGVKRKGFDGLGPHALRRTCASTLLASGATIREVQTVMRHASLATTERYLRRPEAEELRTVMEAGPLAGLPREG